MNWSNLIWIFAGLFGSLIFGLVAGNVAARIKYPDPDKPHVFTPRQNAFILAGVLLAVAAMAFAVFYQPKPKEPSMDEMMGGMGGEMMDGQEGLYADEMLDGELLDAVEPGEPADGELLTGALEEGEVVPEGEEPVEGQEPAGEGEEPSETEEPSATSESEPEGEAAAEVNPTT